MSDILPILTALATGLASVAIVAGYHLLLPAPEVAFVGASPMRAAMGKPMAPRINPFEAIAGAFKRWRRQKKAIDTMLSLDDHLLRDIGLTRGIMISIKPADGRPRGLYADMIAHRLRHF